MNLRMSSVILLAVVAEWLRHWTFESQWGFPVQVRILPAAKIKFLKVNT